MWFTVSIIFDQKAWKEHMGMINETLELICRNANINVGIPIGDVGIILDVIENTKTR